MKFSIGILSVLFPLLSFAAPKTLVPGTYSYRNFSVQVKRRFETVYASTAQGQDRLKELKANKYTCENIANDIHLCSAFLPVQGTEKEISAQVEKELSGVKLEIFQAQGEPELVSQGEAVQEWKVPQAIRFKGRDYSSHRLIRNSQLEKIFLGSPAQETFILNENRELSYSMQLPLTESRTAYNLYFILSNFR